MTATQRKETLEQIIAATGDFAQDRQETKHHSLRMVSYSSSAGFFLYVFNGSSLKKRQGYRFTNAAKRESFTQAVVAQESERVNAIQKRKDERAKGHSFKTGDIVVNAWGWEQTNIDFYRVVSSTKRFVTLQQLQSVDTWIGDTMTGTSVPSEVPTGKTIKLSATGNGINFKYGSGSAWNGKPQHFTSYA